jgi:hypothetical protein
MPDVISETPEPRHKARGPLITRTANPTGDRGGPAMNHEKVGPVDEVSADRRRSGSA